MKNKFKKEFDRAARANIKKEMSKPRLAKSAREAEANLLAARIAQGKLGESKLSLLPPVLQRAG